MSKSSFQKKHFYLVAGEVKFANKADETIGSTLLNAILPWDDKALPVRAIGRAQQALQINFRGKIDNDPSIEVVDVVIINMTYLGHMSQAEFEKPPEGMRLQERGDAVSDPAADPFKLN